MFLSRGSELLTLYKNKDEKRLRQHYASVTGFQTVNIVQEQRRETFTTTLCFCHGVPNCQHHTRTKTRNVCASSVLLSRGSKLTSFGNKDEQRLQQQCVSVTGFQTVNIMQEQRQETVAIMLCFCHGVLNCQHRSGTKTRNGAPMLCFCHRLLSCCG